MPDIDEIKQQIKEAMVERLFLNVSPSEIEDEVPLQDTYGIDSVAILEMIVGLEEIFGVSFEDEDFSPEIFTNVQSIAEFVERKLAANT